MSIRNKALRLKMIKIECSHVCMRVWSSVCGMLFRTHHFCSRNKMYKTSFVVYHLYNKAFAMHDVCYRKTKHMLEAALKECARLEE